MTDQKTAREQRLKAALRGNLRKRKAQQAQPDEHAPAQSPDHADRSPDQQDSA